MVKRKKDQRPSNDLQNTTQKTKDRATRATLKSGGELRCSGRVSSSCSVIVCFVHTRALLTVLFTPGLIIKICFLSLDFKLDAMHSISEDSQILLVHMHSRTSYKIIGRTFPLKKRTCLYFLCFVLTIYRIRGSHNKNTDNKQ
jgi:hypothetical protein